MAIQRTLYRHPRRWSHNNPISQERLKYQVWHHLLNLFPLPYEFFWVQRIHLWSLRHYLLDLRSSTRYRDVKPNPSLTTSHVVKPERSKYMSPHSLVISLNIRQSQLYSFSYLQPLAPSYGTVNEPTCPRLRREGSSLPVLNPLGLFLTPKLITLKWKLSIPLTILNLGNPYLLRRISVGEVSFGALSFRSCSKKAWIINFRRRIKAIII